MSVAQQTVIARVTRDRQYRIEHDPPIRAKPRRGKPKCVRVLRHSRAHDFRVCLQSFRGELECRAGLGDRQLHELLVVREFW
eukprot:COSAG05_NODE_332_length_11268_cov_132.023726_13_plen_82_part_00